MIFSNLLNFSLYFGSSLALLGVALTTYVKITPYDEIKLIRDGNVAASLSFLGTVLGMVIALSSVITHSVSIMDMLSWGSMSLFIQLVIWSAVNAIFGNLKKAIAEDQDIAHGIILGGASFAVGSIEAACLVY